MQFPSILTSLWTCLVPTPTRPSHSGCFCFSFRSRRSDFENNDHKFVVREPTNIHSFIHSFIHPTNELYFVGTVIITYFVNFVKFLGNIKRRETWGPFDGDFAVVILTPLPKSFFFCYYGFGHWLLLSSSSRCQRHKWSLSV